MGPNTTGHSCNEAKFPCGCPRTREDTFFRYKSIMGDRLHARHPKSQEAEALIACNILNRMTELGRPESFAIGA